MQSVKDFLKANIKIEQAWLIVTGVAGTVFFIAGYYQPTARAEAMDSATNARIDRLANIARERYEEQSKQNMVMLRTLGDMQGMMGKMEGKLDIIEKRIK